MTRNGFQVIHRVNKMVTFRYRHKWTFQSTQHKRETIPPVVCLRAHASLTMFGSSLPPVVCMKAHVLLTMLDSSLPPVVCVRAHVLLTMFGSSVPPVVCKER